MDKRKDKQAIDKRKQKIIDLSKFITAEDVQYDPDGSWTGTTAATYYGNELEEPIQDADDL